MKTDLDIARNAPLLPIADIAAQLGVPAHVIEPYGRYKAKLPLSLIDEAAVARSHLILVSAITPTPAGEGKTTTSVALAQAMNRLGKQTTVVLREPSLGPVFGMKGGATGGGYAQVVPMEDINLHFTGDFAAIEKANNLLAALIDNHLQTKGATPALDPRTIVWKRAMDMNDRALRNLVIGLGGKAGGVPREAGFNITAASEVMAILCLSQSPAELKAKLGACLVGFTYDNQPVYARDLNAQGAMAVLLKDALQPNLVQTLEQTPALIHGGPFANIAQGTNTILATKMGLSLSDYVVTEAGFGFDLGGEKFLNIKCGYGGLRPEAVVLVATVRALRYHGGQSLQELATPNLSAVEKGIGNLARHIESARKFGLPVVVAINHFTGDGADELAFISEYCRSIDAPCAVNEGWAKGGAGALDLAALVIAAVAGYKGTFKPLYDWADPVETKIQTIVREIYGGRDVVFQPKARTDLATIRRLGLEGLPVCMAKTQKSLSDNEALRGRPDGFDITVREIEIAAGAGFVIPITGAMLRMPGLPAQPAAYGMDIDDDGVISGLS